MREQSKTYLCLNVEAKTEEKISEMMIRIAIFHKNPSINHKLPIKLHYFIGNKS